MNTVMNSFFERN
jgi:hypothetical protein